MKSLNIYSNKNKITRCDFTEMYGRYRFTGVQDSLAIGAEDVMMSTFCFMDPNSVRRPSFWKRMCSIDHALDKYKNLSVEKMSM